MKILKNHIKLTLIIGIITAFLPIFSYAQVVYKGVNSAIAKGTALGKEVNDNSNTGTTVNKIDDSPTQIAFPMIGLAKTVSAPVIQANGTYNVTYTLRIQNYSTVALNPFQLAQRVGFAVLMPKNWKSFVRKLHRIWLSMLPASWFISHQHGLICN